MLESQLARLLASRGVLRLATTNGFACPWIAAAYFVERGLYSLELLLAPESRTMGNILVNPQVAVMVDGADAFTLFAQGEGLARMVEDPPSLLADRLRLKTPASAPLVRRPGLVGVCIEVDRWWLNPGGGAWTWQPERELRRPRLVGLDECPDYA